MWYPIGEDGAELIVNGTFDNTIAWTLGSAWGIGGGVAGCVLDPDPAENILRQNTPFVDGEDYDISFDVTFYDLSPGAWFECHVNDPSSHPQVAQAVGHYDWTVTAGPGLLYPGLWFDFGGTFQAGDVIAIDNVEILIEKSELFVDSGFGVSNESYYRAYPRDNGDFVQHYTNREFQTNVMIRTE